MIELTAPRKTSIVVESPVLFAAGIAGYDGSPYRKLLSLDKFGALVTSPVTLKPRYPAHGSRVVPLPSGFLMHTGLPNRGIKRVIRDYEKSWRRSVLPIILHILADSMENVEAMVRQAERCESIAGIELGLHDQITIRELQDVLHAAVNNTDLPIIARLPLYNVLNLSDVAQRNGVDALVIAAPPRGTERDAAAGRLVGGRVYGPWLKSQALRLVGRVVQYSDVPIIASGGIHTPDDARDFITAGARAVQLDTVVWVNPKMAEIIARNLGGSELTRTSGALADEWEPGMGETQRRIQEGQPMILPEMPPEDDITRDTPTESDYWTDSLKD